MPAALRTLAKPVTDFWHFKGMENSSGKRINSYQSHFIRELYQMVLLGLRTMAQEAYLWYLKQYNLLSEILCLF